MLVEYIRKNIGLFIASLLIITNIIIIKFKKKNNNWINMNLGNSLIAELVGSFPLMKILLYYLYIIINLIIRKIIFYFPGIILSILYIIFYVVKHHILGL